MTPIEAAYLPPADWPRSSRIRKPYTFHKVRVQTEPDPPSVPRLLDRDWQQAVQHLKGPIHPHLLKLEPGSYDSITRFAEHYGLDEMTQWGVELGVDYQVEPWLQIYADLSNLDAEGVATVTTRHLLEAWGIGSTEDTFREEQERLRQAFETAETAEGADEAFQTIVDTTGNVIPEVRLVAWPVQPVDSGVTLGLVEAPADIIHRAWLELYDELQAGGLPRPCGRCRNPFIGSNRSQEYCSRECQLQAYGKRRRSPYRREYERMYQRMRRKTISQNEFSAWKKRQAKE